MILHSARTVATLGPNPGWSPLLTNTRLVLPPSLTGLWRALLEWFRGLAGR